MNYPHDPRFKVISFSETPRVKGSLSCAQFHIMTEAPGGLGKAALLASQVRLVVAARIHRNTMLAHIQATRCYPVPVCSAPVTSAISAAPPFLVCRSVAAAASRLRRPKCVLIISSAKRSAPSSPRTVKATIKNTPASCRSHWLGVPPPASDMSWARARMSTRRKWWCPRIRARWAWSCGMAGGSESTGRGPRATSSTFRRRSSSSTMR